MDEISLKVRKILVTHYWHETNSESSVRTYRNNHVINQELLLFTNTENVQLCCRGLDISYQWVIVFEKSNDIIVYENFHLKGRTTWESFDDAIRALTHVENSEHWDCYDSMCLDFLVRVLLSCIYDALRHQL
jgi:hypothetical protein